MEKMTMRVIDAETTGRRIKQYRLDRGMKPSDLMKYFDFSTERTIHYWEKGTFMPTIDHFGILVSVFNITLNDLVVFKTVEITFD